MLDLGAGYVVDGFVLQYVVRVTQGYGTCEQFGILLRPMSEFHFETTNWVKIGSSDSLN